MLRGEPRELISGRRVVNCQGFIETLVFGVSDWDADSASDGISLNGFINSEKDVRTTSFRLKRRLKNSPGR